MFAIYKKELRSYFITPVGFVYVGIFLALSALLCCYTTLQSMSYNTSTYFMFMVFALVILIPISKLSFIYFAIAGSVGSKS